MADAAAPFRRDPPRRTRQPRDDGASSIAPPHDTEMEESLLGAMLLDEGARTAALETVTAADFYRPAHAVVFAAISSLMARGHPVDVVTVRDELARTGLLEELGDPTTLVAWQADTPSLANGRYYAERVAALAGERRLLGYAVELGHAIRTGDAAARERALEAIAAGGGDAARIAHQLVREDLGTLMRDPSPPVEPELLRRTDGRALLLRGMVTIVHAEPSSGKSWLAAEAVRQVTAAGESACILDYEGNGTTWAGRLNALGATPTDIDDHLDYIRPGDVPRAVLAAEAFAKEPALVVIDGLAAALAQSGLDENANSETLVWLRQVARAIAQRGAAVVVIDHVAKDKEARGRWGRGASAKLGETDAAFGLEVVEPYTRTKPGSAYLRIAKDRHGAIGPERSIAAVVRFTPAEGGASLSIEIEPPPEGAGEWTGPTDAMTAVRTALEQCGQELSLNQLVAVLKASGKSFRKQTVGEAAERLAADPVVPIVVRAGPRGSRMFRHDPTTVALPYGLDDDEEEPF